MISSLFIWWSIVGLYVKFKSNLLENDSMFIDQKEPTNDKYVLV